jgi:hypothetical protein
MEERANGEIVLRPVELDRDYIHRIAGRLPAFEIAKVERIVLSSREERSARC